MIYQLSNVNNCSNRNCLMQTIQQTIHIQEFVKSKGIEIKFHGRNKNEASHYCGQCEVRYSNNTDKTDML